MIIPPVHFLPEGWNLNIDAMPGITIIAHKGCISLGSPVFENTRELKMIQRLPSELIKLKSTIDFILRHCEVTFVYNFT